MADETKKLHPINALMDDEGNIWVAQEDLEAPLRKAEEVTGYMANFNLQQTVQARGPSGPLQTSLPLTAPGPTMSVGGIKFRYIISNKEWQE